MAQTEDFDLIIIGGGPGGYVQQYVRSNSG